MFSRRIQVLVGGVAIVGALQVVAVAEECPLLDMSRPACGKVCKLVCETKKLTAIGYGNECKEICLPGPSRPGCKHCSTCCGECKCDPCAGCQSAAPKCEFCWRDWFACGCAKPRSVKVLTKYQAEKKICWYHWEVIDASCCESVSKDGDTAAVGDIAISQLPGAHSFYKPAPENAELGDVLPVTEDEWVKLAAVLTPDPRETTVQVADNSAPKAEATNNKRAGEAVPLKAESETPSIAGRIERFLRR